MFLPKFQYVQPVTIEEACSFLEQHKGESAVLAGGTDLMLGLRRRLQKPNYVVGLKKLKELNYVRTDDAGALHVGALTTLESIETLPAIVQEYPALAHAAELAAVPSIRRTATLGGNLSLDTRCIYYNQSEFWRKARADCFKLGGDVCHAVDKGRRCLAVYQGDLAPILMAMDAKVRIVSANTERTISLAEFFTGKGETPNVLKPGEILAEVIIPKGTGKSVGAYEKLRVREGMDFPLAGVAVSLNVEGNGTVSQAKIILSAVGSAPVEIAEAATLLVGKKMSDDLLEEVAETMFEKAHPAANLAIDARYRRAMVKVLTKRATRNALQAADAK